VLSILCPSGLVSELRWFKCTGIKQEQEKGEIHNIYCDAILIKWSNEISVPGKSHRWTASPSAGIGSDGAFFSLKFYGDAILSVHKWITNTQVRCWFWWRNQKETHQVCDVAHISRNMQNMLFSFQFDAQKNCMGRPDDMHPCTSMKRRNWGAMFVPAVFTWPDGSLKKYLHRCGKSHRWKVQSTAITVMWSPANPDSWLYAIPCRCTAGVVADIMFGLWEEGLQQSQVRPSSLKACWLPLCFMLFIYECGACAARTLLILTVS
jgi:hypothetical protein